MVRECRATDYEFTLKPTWRGYVLMYRGTRAANGYGDWEWDKWRKATWKDMTRLKKEELR